MGSPDIIRQSMAVHNTATSEALLSYRALLVQKATQKMPYTAEGLPVGYYRVDLLPAEAQEASAEMEAIHVAYQDLSFEHGYPTLHDGRPFWHKFDFEPGFAYGAFQIYLEQIDSGPREIFKMTKHEELLRIASRTNNYKVDEGELMPETKLGHLLVEYSVLYNWRTRAKAHDLYQEAAYRHVRLRRQASMENNHFELAENYLKELKSKVLDTPEFWDSMSPKTAVEFLGKLVGIGRISVGLPMSGPLSQKETPQDTTFEMLLRTVGQRTSGGRTFENGALGREVLDNILRDRGSVESMQELIIKVSKATSNPSGEQTPQGHRFKGRNNRRESYGISGNDLSTGFDMTGVPGAQEEPNLDSNSDAVIVSETKNLPEKKD